MVRADAKYVADLVWAVMWASQRLNVMGLGVKRTIWQLNRVSANLALEAVHELDAACQFGVAQDAIRRDGDSVWF